MNVETPLWQTGVFIAVLGLGMGFLMQTTMLIAQNSVAQKDLGVASSASTFFRSIGGSFGVALFGAVFNNHLTDSLTDKFGPQAADMVSSGGSMSPAAIAQLPAEVKGGFLESLAGSISGVFLWAIVFAVVVPILAAFIKEVPLRGRPRGARQGRAGPGPLETLRSGDGPAPRRGPYSSRQPVRRPRTRNSPRPSRRSSPPPAHRITVPPESSSEAATGVVLLPGPGRWWPSNPPR